MKEHLFHEFPAISAEQWKQQITTDLKGAGYDENLVYKSPDGVNVKPFYTSEDIKGSIQLPPTKAWSICEKIRVANAGEANLKAKNVLEKGAESLWFVISSEEVAPNLLLIDLDLKNVQILLNLQFLSEDYINRLSGFLSGKENQVFLQLDPIGKLARSGNYFFNSKKDITILKSAITEAKKLPSVISVDASLYQNAGATIPQQLGYALAHLNEYLNILSQQGQISAEFLPQFILATGGNYFFEIAKIKALRWIYASLAKEYKLTGKCLILSQPTRRDKTLYDYNVNLLRTTTQSMSAILGGADVVYNEPYDAIFNKPTEFGERIARNQLLVMKHEAYFDKVANASDGAYYIESLTREFSDAALQIFRDIEKDGGFLNSLQQGKIQQNIQQSADKEQELFDKGKLILVGTNKFANPQDEMAQHLELDPFTPAPSENTVIKPFIAKRLSEKQEQERLQKEKAVLIQS